MPLIPIIESFFGEAKDFLCFSYGVSQLECGCLIAAGPHDRQRVLLAVSHGPHDRFQITRLSIVIHRIVHLSLRLQKAAIPSEQFPKKDKH